MHDAWRQFFHAITGAYPWGGKKRKKRAKRATHGRKERKEEVFGLHWIRVLELGEADHAGCRVTRRSTSGILIFVNRAPILWYSKRQNTVENSSFPDELQTARWLQHTYEYEYGEECAVHGNAILHITINNPSKEPAGQGKSRYFLVYTVFF